MANIQNDPHHRSTGPIKSKTQPIKPKDSKPTQKKVKQETDSLKLDKLNSRASNYKEQKAEGKEKKEKAEEKGFMGWLKGLNDGALDPLGKGETVKGAIIRHLAEPLEAMGNKIGKALTAVDGLPLMKGLGKALPIVGLIPTAFDIKAAFDDNKNPKVSQNDKSLSTAKAVFSSIASATGIAAAFTGATGVGAPVALALGGVSLIFSIASWATDLGKDKK